MLPLIFLGVPSAISGLAFIAAAGILAARKSKEDMKGALAFAVIGAVLIGFLFVSPRLASLVDWATGHVGP